MGPTEALRREREKGGKKKKHNQALYYTLRGTKVEVWRLYGGGRFQPEAKCRQLASDWKPGPSQMRLMGRLFFCMR